MITSSHDTINLIRRGVRKFGTIAPMIRANYVLKRGGIVATWFAPTQNWGDALNPYLIHRLAQRPVIHHRHLLFGAGSRPVYSVVGSILQQATSPNSVVWGSGFIAHNGKMQVRPRRVLAVRGPLTRELLLKDGIECPAVYGDPALLMPMLYAPKLTGKRYRLGVVPHYLDRDHPWLETVASSPNVCILDIESGIEEFVDQLTACDAIASSSLHGLIASDAYRVPSVWIEFGDRLKGGHFKFKDYFSSMGWEAATPLRIESGVSPDEVLNHARLRTPSLDLGALIDACPFIDEKVARRLRAAVVGAWDRTHEPGG